MNVTLGVAAAQRANRHNAAIKAVQSQSSLHEIHTESIQISAGSISECTTQ